MSVVYFHAVIQVRHVGQLTWRMIGACGVDIFFVLSGFVMWSSTMRNTPSMIDFIKRRIVRVAPLYWLLTLAVAIVSLIVPDILRSTRFDIPHLIASLLFLPWPNPAMPARSPELLSPVIIPGWTLNMEMMFYALFAMCLPLRRAIRPSVLLVFLVVLMAVGMASGGRGLYSAFYGRTIMLEFWGGVALAAYLVPRLRLSSPIAIAVIVIGLWTLFTFEGIKPDLPRAVYLGVPALLVIAGAISLERLGKVPKIPVMEALGDASYSIYLSHLFVIAGSRIIVSMSGITFDAAAATAFVPIAMVAAAVFGWLLHVHVERPMINYANTFLRGRRPAPDATVLR